MVRLGLRRKKHVQRVTPGGRVVTHYKRKQYSKPKCAVCGAELHGTARKKPKQMHNLSKAKKRPERPFGGQLCSKCTRKVILLKAKYKLKLIGREAIPLSLKDYVIGK